MKVDQEFVDAVMATTEGRYPHEIIEATLAVAAERGMVVPEGAPKMWASKGENGLSDPVYFKTTAESLALSGETVVRVAIVEIKE